MSDKSEDASVLGKHARDGADEEDVGPQPAAAGGGDMDDSDDDVGPMPMPADAAAVPKKKRKGACVDLCASSVRLQHRNT